MSLVRSRRGLAALTFPLLVALACSGEGLASADGVACTRGRLDTGAPKFGEISTESCLLWSDWEYKPRPRRSESWTLDLKAHSAYVIRLVPVDAAGDTSALDGDLSAYAPTRAGDPVFSATWKTYVNGNPRTRELVIVSDRDREVSVRVNSYAGFGAYRLEVQRCAARTIADGETIADIQVDGGCTVSGLIGSVTEAVFLMYRVASPRAPNITVERTAGNGTLKPLISGFNLDLGDDILVVAPPTTTSAILSPRLDSPGMYTIFVGVTPGTTATMRVSVDEIPAQP